MTFQDRKNHLGITEPQNRKTSAARRTVSTGFLLYGLIVWWHEPVRETPATYLRSWPGKDGASFADMLAALRLETTQEISFSTPQVSTGVRKSLERLTRLVSLAT